RGGVVLRERGERDQRRVRTRVRPRRARVEQVGPGETEEKDWRIARERGEVLEQVEQRRLGPLDVIDADDQGPLTGERLGELPESPGDFLRSSAHLAHSDGTADSRGNELGIAVLLEKRCDLLARIVAA